MENRKKTDELKPCKLCGDSGEVLINTETKGFITRCKNEVCIAHGFHSGEYTERADAVAAWNRRHGGNNA